nr:conserved hypothetical protein, SAM-dependent methyltransferase type 11 family [uncultured archaeon]
MRKNNLSHDSLKGIIKRHWDGRSNDYGKFRGYGSEEEKIAWMDVLSSALGTERRNVLDVGTGPGDIAIYLAEMEHDVTGIDFSDEMLKRAKGRVKNSNLQVKFDICDAEDLYFEDESFDAVICRHLLWTLPNPGKALREWTRVVKPGGKIVVIDGKWRSSSPIDRMRRLIRSLVFLVYEQRKPPKSYKKEINGKLPFRNGAEPEKVVELFNDLELVNVSAQDITTVREAQRRNMPWLYRRIWGTHPTFLMIGEKSR